MATVEESDLLIHPHRSLRTRSREVYKGEDLGEKISEAIEMMLSLGASSFSLVQMGTLKRVILINGIGGRVLTIVNPTIVAHKGKITVREICPSLPGKRYTIERSQYVRVEYDRPEGPSVIDAYELDLAIALQHECDHLNGVLLLDRHRVKEPPQAEILPHD